VSPQGPFEQGKDIITADAQEHAHGYQLKVGDISLARWRDEVKAEIDELLDVPIIHPSIDKRAPHRSHLVTTGNLADPVRRLIDDVNEARLRGSKGVLETETRGQLLKAFVEAHEDTLPKEVDDLRSFFELYTRPGQYNVPKEKLAKLLASVLPPLAEGAAPTPRQVGRAAASALLMASYLLATYEREQNHWAAAEGWAMTTAHLLAVAERHGGSAGLTTTIGLSKTALFAAVGALKEEVLDRTAFFEPGMVDGPFYRYRVAIMLGYLAAYQLAKKVRGDADWHDPKVNELIAELGQDLRLTGEAPIAHVLPVYWYLQASGEGEQAEALYTAVLSGVADAASNREGGLVSPYYEFDALLRADLGLLEEPVDESFALQSYVLRALVTIGARRGHRAPIADKWRKISKVHCSEFYQGSPAGFFVWREEEGELRSAFLQRTQSWAALQAEAQALARAATVPGQLGPTRTSRRLFWWCIRIASARTSWLLSIKLSETSTVPDRDPLIAGAKRASDWRRLRQQLVDTPTTEVWEQAYDEYFVVRLDTRYFEPIRRLKGGDGWTGEGFSIMVILCSLVEFLETTVRGLKYVRGRKPDPALHEYSSSKDVFVDFLAGRKPFADVFTDRDIAMEFYEAVRCGLMHEAQTNLGWMVWATSHRRAIIDRAEKTVFRDDFCFIRKFDSLCK